MKTNTKPAGSNLDATTLRLVRKGLRVQQGDRVGVVAKTSGRLSACLVLWDGERYARPVKCAEVVVL